MSSLEIYKTEMYQQLLQLFGQALTVVESSSLKQEASADTTIAIPIKENHRVVGYLSFNTQMMNQETKDLLNILLESNHLIINLTNQEYELWRAVCTLPLAKWQERWQQLYGPEKFQMIPIYVKLYDQHRVQDDGLQEKVKDIVEAYLVEEIRFIPIEEHTCLFLIPASSTEGVDPGLLNSLKDLKGIIMTELFIDTLIYMGEPVHLPGELSKQINMETEYLKLIQHKRYSQAVITLKDILPQLFATTVSHSQAANWFSKILEVLQEEQELIHTLKVFFEENLNVSEAAKKLYIHRNSLQYRLDKFFQKTGYDLKRFQDAHIAYQALHVLGTFNKSSD